MDKQEYQRARLSAMNSLSRREHSEYELSSKLQSKNFSPELIRVVIDQLIIDNLLSNARYCENYIRFRRNKGYGPKRIRIELQARRVPTEMIEEMLDITHNSWFLEAKNVLFKRFKKIKPIDFSARSQQMRFLQYRGFTSDHINALFHSDFDYE
jgi:regulatory protein